MQSKTIMRYYQGSTRMAKKEKWQYWYCHGCEKTGTLRPSWQKCTLVEMKTRKEEKVKKRIKWGGEAPDTEFSARSMKTEELQK